MSASSTSAAINSTNPTARLGIQCMAKLIRTDPSLRCLNHDAEHDQNQCSSDRQPERKESRAFVPKERVQGREHDNQDADVPHRLAEEVLGSALVDHRGVSGQEDLTNLRKCHRDA